MAPCHSAPCAASCRCGQGIIIERCFNGILVKLCCFIDGLRRNGDAKAKYYIYKCDLSSCDRVSSPLFSFRVLL